MVIETDPFPRCFLLFPQIQKVDSSLFSQICGVVQKGNSKSIKQLVDIRTGTAKIIRMNELFSPSKLFPALISCQD